VLKKLMLVVAAAGLAGCNTATTMVRPEADYIVNAKEHVDKADWKNQKVVTVTLEEHSFTPQNMTFEVGKAYKLELKNVGEKDHYYTATDFFKAVAWRKAMVNKQAELKAPYFTAVEVLKKGGQLDLYFVPVTKGSYKVICTIDDHREKGMEGTVTIE
jgi:uncharacterized cupredoxin-like copper-binding protein